MANVTEYLCEIEADDAVKILEASVARQAEVMIKVENEIQPYAGKMVSLSKEFIIFETAYLDKIISGKEQASIKFFVGTEVYFIKAPLELNQNRLALNINSKLIQLKRRKEPRYLIPDKWNQTAAIWSIATKTKNDAKIIDISNSGIRFDVIKLTLEVSKNDKIRIQFQVHKRSEVVCDAVVKFVLKRPNGSCLLGLEFAFTQDSHKSRVRSIVEDCIAFTEKQT